MFRPMRRVRQQLPEEECLRLLRCAPSGVLAVLGDDGYPYAVPLAFACADGCLYFHCAVSGHKLDAIRQCDKASFCVVARDDVVPEKYTTLYQSVIAFGRVEIVPEEGERLRILRLLAEKYNPAGSADDHTRAIDKTLRGVCVLKMRVERMTGKEGIELTRARQNA